MAKLKPDTPPKDNPLRSSGGRTRDKTKADAGPLTTSFSDIDLRYWKKYEALTGSLWLLGARDRTGPHVGDYWGNFVPQIPRRILLRFTKEGEVVVDLFSGMGTTLIECRHLGRHGIGVELNPEVAARSEERIAQADNPHGITTAVLTGDATAGDTISRVWEWLARLGHSHAHCLILHPPYHDIIQFSHDPRDLSNATNLRDFLDRFRTAAGHAHTLLAEGRFMALVIGDKYVEGEWIPLAFECMQVCRQLGFQLKAINVKDIQGNERGKGKRENLWKYRALRQGIYIFKHEYVMLFQKLPAGQALTHTLTRLRDHFKALDDEEGYDLLSGRWRIDSLASLMTYKQLLHFIDPARILVLRDGNAVRAAVIDLSGQDFTDDSIGELQRIVTNLQPTAVQVSVIANDNEKRAISEVEGITTAYDPASIEFAAQAVYLVRKSIGWAQRVGVKAGERFTESLNRALARYFAPEDDYIYSARQELAFRFFRKHSSAPFGSSRKYDRNFRVGIVVKWVSDHETEKLPQIQHKYFRKGYTLIAILGPNKSSWRSAIESPDWGDFADYYMFVDKGEDSDKEPFTEYVLWQTVDGKLTESSDTLKSLLQKESVRGEGA